MSPNLGITICGYLSIGCCVLAAIRKFVDQVSGEVLDESRRKNVIDAALDLTEELVTGRIEFFRSVVRSAGQAVGK